MTYSYSSNFKAFIEGLVQQKNAVGYKYERAEYYLWTFDRFCMAKFPDETILSHDEFLISLRKKSFMRSSQHLTD